MSVENGSITGIKNLIRFFVSITENKKRPARDRLWNIGRIRANYIRAIELYGVGGGLTWRELDLLRFIGHCLRDAEDYSQWSAFIPDVKDVCEKYLIWSNQPTC